MKVQHYRTLMHDQGHLARPQAMCWSPNNKRLAVADANRFVHLYDEQGERRDKFATKSADSKSGRGFVITGMVFSPDSSKLAIAQSDNIVSIYRVGLEWGDKKSICSKFPQTHAVSCVAWPSALAQGVELVAFGTEEGKVKVGVLKANKSQTLYTHDHAVVSLATSVNGAKLVSGHLDGAVYVYVFDAEDSPGGNNNSAGSAGSESATETVGARRLFTHTCVPYVLSWGEQICAAGADGIVAFYSARSGQKLQAFDYPLRDEGEFTSGAFNPSGQAVVVGSRDRMRVFDYNARTRKFVEGAVLQVPNSYSFPVMTWKHDGSKLVVGAQNGAVDMFDACLKRYRLRGAFEFTYVCSNQVIVKRLATGTRIVLRSNMGYEVQRVHVYQDRYLVAHTSTTLLVGDLVSCKLSEVPWQLSGREKFVFDNPQVCMVFTVGELCLIEYGKNTLLGTCRTEERSAHRISVVIHDPIVPAAGAEGTNNSNINTTIANAAGVTSAGVIGSNGATTAAPITTTAAARDGRALAEDVPKRFIAYLIDRQTIQVDNLVSGVSVARIAHTYKIDWLELNYRADKLLYRDKQHQLLLYDLLTQQRITLINYCTYVQWVPGSDVVVAQNRVELCVWYSIDHPDKVAMAAIKGEVEGIERGNGKTEVIVDEGVNTVAYGLDESMIEFGTAMEEHDLDRACELLDKIALTPETETMWATLAAAALREMRLRMAERCYAALGDVARVKALQAISELAQSAAAHSHTESTSINNNRDGYSHYTVRAALYALNKEFKQAEQLYLENNDVEAAMAMWEEMGCAGEAIAIAEARGLDDLPNRRARYYSWLMETHQFDKAGAVKEKEGKYIDAINLYLRGGAPAKAAQVVSAHNLKPEQQLLEAIAAALCKAQVFDKAGEFFEKLRMPDRALETYERGHVYHRAVEYAKSLSREDKVRALEEAWGDFLVSQRHVDQAINHYTEAGRFDKAVKAAIDSRQWSKAGDLLEAHSSLASDGEAGAMQAYYRTIAQHYAELHRYDEAEKFFIAVGAVNEAVEMYSRANLPDPMFRVAQRHLSQQQLVALFINQAKQLEAKGDYAGAERVYLKVNEPDQAIVMYKKARDFTNMIRLVQIYRADYLEKTHLSLGAQFEKENNLKTAETHYVAGKDWGRAVNMYRDRDMWDDAVRVAKIHGGANAARQVVLSRVIAIDAEEGVQLLTKFNLVEQGIDFAVESMKFDLALQWAQMAQPSKVPYVWLRYAMHYEDQGDFRMAEDAFLKAGKPREAIDMYVHQQDFDSAMRVAEGYDQAAIAGICAAHGRAAFQRGSYAEAEALFLRAGSPEVLLKLYLDARLYSEAQRLAKAHCPEMLAEVAKRIALQSNDPQKAGAVLEENGEYQMAIDMYLGASAETVPDETTLTNLWIRAVRVAQKHVRKSLKEVLRGATAKLKEIHRYVEAGRCLEECEDYKAAINLYVQGKKFDLAETLARRISPELEDYVRRAIVQDSIEGGTMRDAKMVEELDPEAAMKAYIAKNDFDNALRLAQQQQQQGTAASSSSSSGASDIVAYTAALKMQYLLRDGQLREALQVMDSYPLDTSDFRFFDTWLELAQRVTSTLLPTPEDEKGEVDLTTFHANLVKVLEQMNSSGQKPEELSRADALIHVVHIYHMARKMRTEYNLPEYATKLMLGLPRWVPHIAPDKAYYDAGIAARDANMEDVAFLYLNHALDIIEHIEEGDADSHNIDQGDFASTDFPTSFPLPKTTTLAKAKMEKMNEWVLTVSIENSKGDRALPMTTDPQTQEQFFEGALKAPNGNTYPECAVTGYPVLGSAGVARCSHCRRTANPADWNRFVLVAKQCPWCGNSESPDFKL